jgi:hypothetical protein
VGATPALAGGCTYDSSAHTAQLVVDSFNGTIVRADGSAAILWQTTTDTGGALEPCGGATIHNTKTFFVTVAPDVQLGIFEMKGGLGTVEFSISGAGSGDELDFWGRSTAANRISAGAGHAPAPGSGAADLSGDGKAEITWQSMDLPLYVFGGAGDDAISAAGGSGTGHAFKGPFYAYGGASSIEDQAGTGDDTLTAGSGPAELVGQDGSDTLTGGSSNDVLDGGPGADAMRGLDGSDDLHAVDGEADSVIDGGKGQDFAQVDCGLDPTPISATASCG